MIALGAMLTPTDTCIKAVDRQLHGQVTDMFPFLLNLRIVRSFAWMLLASLLLPAAAQTAPAVLNLPVAVGTAGYGLVEAGDGNFYAMSLNGPPPSYCADDATMICSYIYQINNKRTASYGSVTAYHTFQRGSSASPTPSNRDGLEPTALVVGLDGSLYGACKIGGPRGFGTIFKIAQGDDLTVLASFGVNAAGTALDPGNQPLSLIQGTDGNLYFLNVTGVYSINLASGALSTVATFPYNLVAQTDPDGFNASSMMQASDGNFYLTMEGTPGILSGDPGANAGGIIQVTPGGIMNVVHAFAIDGSEGLDPFSQLVQGPDGYLYGATRTSNASTGIGMAFKVQPNVNGPFISLGPLPGQTSGHPNNALFVGSDGNLYGTTPLGGATTATHCTPFGCGMLFKMTPSGTFSTVYAFQGGSEASPTSNPNDPVDGAFPDAPVVQGDDGNFFGGSIGIANNAPVFFDIDPQGEVGPPVILSVVSTGGSGVNNPVTVNWTVSNAFSDTAQNCGALVQGGLSGVSGWSGRLTGTLSNGVYQGSKTITATQPGSYTLALVCGGNEVGFATLTVSAGFSIFTPAFPDAQVNEYYSGAIGATGGTEPYTWTISNIPPGLANGGGGSLGGTPTQFGDYILPVTVTDRSTPPQQINGTVTLKVISGLKIKTPPATIKATQNATFGLPIDFVGGLPPYIWTVSAGSLPDGLKLNDNGSITGKPTTVGSSKFTLQVADSEATPDKKTVMFTLKIVPDIQIAAVEFTQAIQQFQYLDDLQTSLTASGEPPVPIISLKRAVMRVYFTRVDKATNVVLTVGGDVSDQRQFSIPPYCEPQIQRSHESPKNCPSIDVYFVPPSGTWSTVLTLNDDSGNQLEQETLTVTSRDALAINLKGVWVCTTPGQPATCQDPANLLTLKAFAEKVLPTASVTVNPTRTRVAEDVSKYAKGEWVNAVKERLMALFTPLDILNDGTSLQRTDYNGVYNHTLAKTSTGIADIGGHAVLISDSFTGVNPNAEQAVEMVLAHEVGHSLSLTHTGIGDPRSPYPGCWNTNVVGPPWGTNWTFGDNYVQDSAGYETGFDVVASTVIQAQSSFELMSYCQPNWITPLNYKRALLYVNPGPAIAPSLKGRGVAIAANPAAHPKPAITLTLGQYWSVSGTLPSAGGATVAPIFTETMPGSIDPGSGTYSIQELNAVGQALYTRFFTPIQGAIDPSFDTTADPPFTDGMFSEFVPVTPGATAIAITDPAGSSLTSIPIAGAPPMVTITSPGSGFAGSGEQSISWNIQSTASATFTSRIYYSADNGTTWEQIDETAAMTDVLDFNTLPGTSSALIRVDVSDGVNTGSATSVPFSVPKKAPSTIVINSPATGAIQQAANPVFLTGGAYDADDGVLSGKALEWSDGDQGSLGSGSPLMVKLKPGSHTITLTARDSDGNALTATKQIMLGGGAPVVSLTTTQTSACYSASINATPGASGADLTAVNYSLDGGATYTPIALTSLPLNLPLNGTGIVNIAAVAVDASGQVSAKSAEVILGAGCISATVKASAGSGQSAVVGTAFTTALTTLVVDLNGSPVSGTTVTYAAPAAGASATLSAATATTNASGIATVTATANNTAGAYNVTASATNGTSTATFALTNSDFTIAPATSAITVKRGASGTDLITLTALGGFNGTVTFGCSGLLAGASCTFAPATVTPTAATTSTTITITASQTASMRWPLGGGSMIVCTLLACILRRRKYFSGLAIIASVTALIGLTACGSSVHTKNTTASITVTATAGSLQRTTTVTLQIE